MLVLDWTVTFSNIIFKYNTETACQLSNLSLCLFHLCSHLTLCVGAPKECFDRGRSASTPCLGGAGDLCGGSSHNPCGWGASGPSLLCWKTCGQNRGRRCWACSREWGTLPWVCGCFPAPQKPRWNRRTRRFRRRSWGRRAARDPWWGPEGGQREATPLRQPSQRENRPSRKKAESNSRPQWAPAWSWCTPPPAPSFHRRAPHGPLTGDSTPETAWCWSLCSGGTLDEWMNEWLYFGYNKAEIEKKDLT